jgi:hypothetical protein
MNRKADKNKKRHGTIMRHVVLKGISSQLVKTYDGKIGVKLKCRKPCISVFFTDETKQDFF